MNDLIIIGGGPAGAAAGVYAARKRVKTLILAKEFGGQSVVSSNIENWIGTTAISGEKLAKDLEAHVRAYAADVLEIKKGPSVDRVSREGSVFKIQTDDGKTYESKTVLVATGAHRRKLDVSGADKFENKGLTYCATCDGPLFTGQDVAVIGGGNAGFETAAQLLAYAKSVILLHRGAEFKADSITIQKVLANPKMKALTNVETLEIFGDNFVKGLEYKDTAKGDERKLEVGGIFVEIGLIPTTGFVKDVVEMNKYNQIIVDSKNQRSSLGGLWAAGDCADGLFHQNNIAAGDAVKAIEDIYMYLQTL